MRTAPVKNMSEKLCTSSAVRLKDSVMTEIIGFNNVHVFYGLLVSLTTNSQRLFVTCVVLQTRKRYRTFVKS